MLRASPPAKAAAFHNGIFDHDGIFGPNGIFGTINRSTDGSKIAGKNSLGTLPSYSLNRSSLVSHPRGVSRHLWWRSNPRRQPGPTAGTEPGRLGHRVLRWL